MEKNEKRKKATSGGVEMNESFYFNIVEVNWGMFSGNVKQ
jgi:hypothetical protein